jgi:rare lipoprotein A
MASWYGEPFHGRLAANGEIYDMHQLTAAHQQAPLGIHAIVTHMRSGRQVRVRITDRGPFVEGRLIDLSYGAARQIDMVDDGLAPVMIEFLPDTEPEVTFMVQAGSYQEARYALATKRRLTDVFPDVLIRKLTAPNTPFYQVLLGPYQTRQKAEFILRGIQPLGYRGLIIPQTQAVSLESADSK